MHKRLIAIGTIGLLVPLLASATNVSIIVDGTSVTLRDVQEGEWYAAPVKAAAEANIVSGYRDAKGKLTGLFGPSDPVTVGQALKMAITAAGYMPPMECGGMDVTPEFTKHWAFPYFTVAYCKHFSFIPTFAEIDKRATRAQVAQIVADAFGDTSGWMSTETTLKDYTDVAKDHVYADAIAVVTEEDIMVGDGRTVHCQTSEGCKKTTFRPDERINRAETVKVVMASRTLHGAPGSTEKLSENGPSTSEVTVTYTDAGFVPSSVSVKAGTTVIFQNKSSSLMRVSSDPHPSHTALPGFDAGEGIAYGAEYRYTFTKAGTWGYHNHLQPSNTGTIIVTP